MIKLNKHILLTAALLCSSIGFAGCSSTAPSTNSNSTTTANNTKPSNNTTTTAPSNTTKTETTTTTSGDKVGVAECDEYIEKVDACLTSKIPEAQRGAYKSSFDTLRKGWKDAAATPQGKTSLAAGCKQALESAKQTYGTYGCTF